MSSDDLALASLDLPEGVAESYKTVGITHMFAWQKNCLSLEHVLDGHRNLVYSAPTSAGKTLVSEILVAKRCLEGKKKAMLILPFVSVSREKMIYFQRLFSSLGLRVGGYMGGHAPAGGFASIDVAVCTIEKGNSLINRLSEAEKLSELGIIVVDELHMIGDRSRGFLLELLLTKLLFSHRTTSVAPQIVGMSATLPNLSLLASWLDAEVFETDYRPVPLTEWVKVENKLLDLETKSMSVYHVPPLLQHLSSLEDDQVIALALEPVLNGHGVLIFCPTKVWCEQLADSLAREIFHSGNAQSPLGAALMMRLSPESLSETVEQLRRCPSGLDPCLARTVPCGVAFHHAGLTVEERDVLESSFRRGVLRVVVATSTLSSGVNLPARRVIVRTPIFHRELLACDTYRQMVGRAGRAGIDVRGESFLVCKPTERSRIGPLLDRRLPAIGSCLRADNLRRAVLEVIANGSVTEEAEAERYLACTLMQTERGETEVGGVLEELEKSQLVWRAEGKLGATHLGCAVLSSSLGPDEGLAVYRELERARRSVALDTDLHLVFLTTPVYLDVGGALDWYRYLDLLEELGEAERRVAGLVGVEERFLVRCVRGQPVRTDRDRVLMRLHRRFYTAMVLHQLVCERPLAEVSEKFAVNKGQLQSLQHAAATYAGMVSIFCERLGWSHLFQLLSSYQSRLIFGVQRELVDLVRVDLINARRARALHSAGIKTVSLLAAARVKDVERVLRQTIPFQRRIGEEEEEEARRGIIGPDGKPMTEAEAAVFVVEEARRLLQEDLAALGVQWSPEAPLDTQESVEAARVDCKPNMSASQVSSASRRSVDTQEGAHVGSTSDVSASQVCNTSRRSFDTAEKIGALLRLSLDVSQRSVDHATSETKSGRNQVDDEDEENCQDEVVDVRLWVTDDEDGDTEKMMDLRYRCTSQERDLTSPEDVRSEDMKGEDDNEDTKRLGCERNSETGEDSERDVERPGNIENVGLSEFNDEETEGTEVVRAAGEEQKADMDRERSKMPEDVELEERQEDVLNGSDSLFPEDDHFLLDTQTEALLRASRKSGDSVHFTVKSTEELTFVVDSQLDDLLQQLNRNEKENSSPLPPPLDDVASQCPSSEGQETEVITFHREPGDQEEITFIIDTQLDEMIRCREQTSDHAMKVGQSAQRLNQQEKVAKKDISRSRQNELKLHKGQTSSRQSEGQRRPMQESMLSNENQKVNYDETQSDEGKGEIRSVGVTGLNRDKMRSGESETRSRQSRIRSDDDEDEVYSGQGQRRMKSGEDATTNQDEIGSGDSKMRSRHGEMKSGDDLGKMDSGQGLIELRSVGSQKRFSKSKTRLEETLEPHDNTPVGPDKTGKDQALLQDATGLLMECERLQIELVAKSSARPADDMKWSGDRSLFPEDADVSGRAGTSDESISFSLLEGILQHAGALVLNKENPVLSSTPVVDDDARNRRIGGGKLGEQMRAVARTKSDKEPPPMANETKKVRFNAMAESDVCTRVQGYGNRQSLIKERITEEHGSMVRRKRSAHEAATSVRTKKTRVSLDVSDGDLFPVDEEEFKKPAMSRRGGLRTLDVDTDADFDRWMAEMKTEMESGDRKSLALSLAIEKAQNGEEHVVGVAVSGRKEEADFVLLSSSQVPRLSSVLQLLQDSANFTSKPVWLARDVKRMCRRLLRLTGSCPNPRDPLVDPLLGLWMLDPDHSPGFDLNRAAAQYLPTDVSERLRIDDKESPRRKAIREALTLVRLWPIVESRLNDRRLLEPFRLVEMATQVLLSKCELGGFIVDEEEGETQLNRLKMAVVHLENSAYKLAGRRFNLHSSSEVAQVLFTELRLPANGIPSTTSTPLRKSRSRSSLPSTSRLVLSRLTSLHPLPGLIIEWRRLSHILTSLSLPRGKSRVSGRYEVHSVTGRLHMTSPNLQMLPKSFEVEGADGKEEVNMRRCLRAASGNCLLSFDYAQLELRLLAHLSADSHLQKLLCSEGDAFRSLAAGWKEKGEAEVSDSERQEAKRICYGLIYGMGAATLGEQMGRTIEEATEMISGFMRSFPGVQRFLSKTVERCRKNGFVSTIFGRRRYIGGISDERSAVRSHAERQAVNSCVQGSAADIAKKAMLEVDHSLCSRFPCSQHSPGKCSSRCTGTGGVHLILHLHDELIYEVSEDSVARVVRLIQRKMENTVRLTVPLPVRVKSGVRWGGLEVLKTDTLL